MNRGDKVEVNKLISSKRVFINADEEKVIPATIAFTAEMRVRSANDPSLPNIYFHTIVSFVNGQKAITSNFNPLFRAIGMNYIKSKF
ncbi:hypothetical protein HYX70_05185 [Candidatus Saccharibacteria bacterium]|nr:hypothetical protein [Candidatus Saccharibacteria bacterium]